jgi:hypothetical protein
MPPDDRELAIKEGDCNCIGASLGIRADPFWPQTQGYVPYGMREVDVKSITKSTSPCKRGEIEFIVASVYDKQDKTWVVHSVGRDRDGLTTVWWSKLGGTLDPGDSLVSSGAWVGGIRDYNAHFEWYFKQISNANPEDIKYRAFCADKCKLRVVEGILSPYSPSVNRD